jgi:hypothetical protein
MLGFHENWAFCIKMYSGEQMHINGTVRVNIVLLVFHMEHKDFRHILTLTVTNSKEFA